MLEKTEGTIKNWQSSILTTCIIPTLLTLFPFPLFILFKLSFKTTFNSVFFSFYVILYRIRKEHYSSTYLLLYHCANDWFFGQLHECSLHHKNMRLCEVKTINVNIWMGLSSFVLIESNLNGYCLNCSESQSSAPGRTNLYGHQYYKN
jgi:hypothetical protein